MATAAKNYRKTGRLPRAITKLSTFMNGMFYTEQIVPDGYAKTLINYDIDYTGNCLRPKMGRVQYADIDNDYHTYMNLEYQYNVNVFDSSYDTTGLIEVVTGFGHYTNSAGHEIQWQNTKTTSNRTVIEPLGKANVWLDPDYGLGLSKNDTYFSESLDHDFKTIYNGVIEIAGTSEARSMFQGTSSISPVIFNLPVIYDDSAEFSNMQLQAYSYTDHINSIIISITDPSAIETSYSLSLDFYEKGSTKLVRSVFVGSVTTDGTQKSVNISSWTPSIPINGNYDIYIYKNDGTSSTILNYNVTGEGDKSLSLNPNSIVNHTSIANDYSNVKSVLLNNNIYTFDPNGSTYKIGSNITFTDTTAGTTTSGELIDYYETYKVKQHYFFNTSLESDSLKLAHDIMPVRLKKPDPLGAATSGFNMLLDDPYSFSNTMGSAWNVLGLFITDSNNNIVLSPDMSGNYDLTLYYQFKLPGNSNNEANIKIQYANIGDTDNWITIATGIIGASTTPYKRAFNVPSPQFIIRVILNEGQTDEVVWNSGVFDTNNLDLKTLDLKNIDITKANQYITWNSYIGAYDIADYNTAIFFSAPNDPGYFPFPDNTIDFLEEIYAVHNYLNMLLVITAKSIYLVTIGDTIQSSSIKKIMSNITVTKWDALDATILNDQFCIRLADQYYIFKPNSYTSDATDIKHYLISAPIAKLLNNSDLGLNTDIVKNILNEFLKTSIIKNSQSNSNNYTCVLNNIEDISIQDKFSYTYKDDLHFVYTLRLGFKVNEYSKGEVVASNKNMFNLERKNIYIDTELEHPTIIIDPSCLINHDEITSVSYKPKTNKLLGGAENIEIKLHLVYDITNRTWRMYIEPTRNSLILELNLNPELYSDVLYYNDVQEYLYGSKNKYRSKFIDPHTNDYLEAFNFQIGSESSKANWGRFVITKLTYDSNTYNPEFESIPDETQPYRWNIANSPQNVLDEFCDIYTYLDTGNISLDDTFLKRFRELQLNLVNYELTKIPFHVNFKLDGQERIDDTNFRIQHITDVNDPDYGLIYITPVEVENLNLYSVTTFADDIEESDCWCLDLSKFPDNERVTLRFGLLGKGRRASVQILNDSLKKYEIADFNWVYRVMNGR